MNGPEHYREAERLLVDAQRISEMSAVMVGTGAYPASEVMVLVSAAHAAAQAHATLALASATATSNHMGAGWSEVLQ